MRAGGKRTKPEAGSQGPRAVRRVYRRPRLVIRVAIPIVIFLVAVLVLGARVDHPDQIIFDEAHYVHWGREIAKGNLLDNCIAIQDAPVNCEHPPLAKHLIAWSLRAHGAGQLDLTWKQYQEGCDKAAEAGQECAEGREWRGCNRPERPECEPEARAWRLPSVLAGAVGISGAFLAASRLFKSTTAGAYAAGLLALDNMWYLQSRMGMLDVFAASFAILGFGLSLGDRWYDKGAGAVVVGLAVASKYSALFILPALALFHFARAWHRNRSLRLFRGGAEAVGYGLVIPMLVLLASYGPYLGRWIEMGGVNFAAEKFIAIQVAAVAWDFGGTFDHPFTSPPWAWILHTKPVFYYWPSHPVDVPPYIYAVGNVALWWPALATMVAAPIVALVGWWRRRVPWSGYLRPYRFIGTPRQAFLLAALVGITTYVPWFLLQRTQFNYYATFNVPTFAVALAGILAWLHRRGPYARALALSWLVVVGVWGALWWPLVYGADINRAQFDALWSMVPWMSR